MSERFGSEAFPPRASGRIPLLVCEAHLEGLALHWQLANRGAVLRGKTRTAPVYRMFAMPAVGTIPSRQALIRDELTGVAIEVEVWELSPADFDDFVSKIPAPLGIGTVNLESGDEVPGFIAEPRTTSGAEEITRFGVWRLVGVVNLKMDAPFRKFWIRHLPQGLHKLRGVRDPNSASS